MNELLERDVTEPFVDEQPAKGGTKLARPSPPPEPHRRHYSRGIVGPTILIGSGAILLLNTTGLVDWDVWTIMWRLWPVILIAIGLDLLFGRRSLAGSALIAATMLVVMIGGAWALASGMTPAATETIAQPSNGISRADVTLAPAAAHLRLAAGGDSAVLIGGTVERARGERLAQNYQGSGSTGTYTLESQEARGLPFVVSNRGTNDLAWDLKLAPDLPITLTVNSGVGQATIDLTGLQLTSLDVHTGVGQTTVTLPSRGTFSAKVEAGVGEVIVRVPAGLAARVHISAGLGDTQVPSGYTRQGDWYVSPGFDAATNRVDLDVSGGVGRVAVEEIFGR